MQKDLNILQIIAVVVASALILGMSASLLANFSSFTQAGLIFFRIPKAPYITNVVKNNTDEVMKIIKPDDEITIQGKGFHSIIYPIQSLSLEFVKYNKVIETVELNPDQAHYGTVRDITVPNINDPNLTGRDSVNIRLNFRLKRFWTPFTAYEKISNQYEIKWTQPLCTTASWMCPEFSSYCPDSGTKTRKCILTDLGCKNPSDVKPSETESCTPSDPDDNDDDNDDDNNEEPPASATTTITPTSAIINLGESVTFTLNANHPDGISSLQIYCGNNDWTVLGNAELTNKQQTCNYTIENGYNSGGEYTAILRMYDNNLNSIDASASVVIN